MDIYSLSLLSLNQFFFLNGIQIKLTKYQLFKLEKRKIGLVSQLITSNDENEESFFLVVTCHLSCSGKKVIVSTQRIADSTKTLSLMHIDFSVSSSLCFALHVHRLLCHLSHSNYTNICDLFFSPINSQFLSSSWLTR